MYTPMTEPLVRCHQRRYLQSDSVFRVRIAIYKLHDNRKPYIFTNDIAIRINLCYNKYRVKSRTAEGGSEYGNLSESGQFLIL